MSAKRKFWGIGIIIAATGVVTARLVSGLVEQGELKFALFVLGITLALGGLGVIMYGMRK